MKPKKLNFEQKAILQRIGITLLTVQMAEKSIKACMTLVFPKDDGSLTLEALEAQKPGEAKKTLGNFLNDLRNRVQVDKEFNDRLSRFLKMRNTFAHQVGVLPGFGIQPDEKVKKVKAFGEFLTELMREAEYVFNVFTGLYRVWREQVGLEDKFKGVEFLVDILQEIDTVYKPMAAQLFSKKQARGHLKLTDSVSRGKRSQRSGSVRRPHSASKRSIRENALCSAGTHQRRSDDAGDVLTGKDPPGAVGASCGEV